MSEPRYEPQWSASTNHGPLSNHSCTMVHSGTSTDKHWTIFESINQAIINHGLVPRNQPPFHSAILKELRSSTLKEPLRTTAINQPETVLITVASCRLWPPIIISYQPWSVISRIKEWLSLVDVAMKQLSISINQLSMQLSMTSGITSYSINAIIVRHHSSTK